MQPKTLKIVLFRWRDPTTHTRWLEGDEARKAMSDECVSVGFLVSEDTDAYRIALSASLDSDSFADTFVVPRSLVTGVREVQEFAGVVDK